MEVFKQETRLTIQRFLERGISFSECASALNAAFADALPRLHGRQLDSLRLVLMANHEIVTQEMERRGELEETEMSLGRTDLAKTRAR